MFIKVSAYARMKNLDALFDDKRVLCLLIACWTVAVSVIFVCIMIDDNSPFLSFGPNPGTVLFGFKLDTWTKWGCIALYTFVSTCIADFTCDSVGPFVTNTIQDHKNLYIPYSKTTCVVIVQVFAVYAIVMNTIGLFVALSQVDFMMIRMSADLMVNYYTCHRFMRYKSVNPVFYAEYMKNHCMEHAPGSCNQEYGKQEDDHASALAYTPPRTPPRALHATQGTNVTHTPHPPAQTTPKHPPVSDLMDEAPQHGHSEAYALYSPARRNDDGNAVFGSAHYT